jgi:hypothetical protein
MFQKAIDWESFLPYVEEKLSPFEEQLGRLLNKFPS